MTWFSKLLGFMDEPDIEPSDEDREVFALRLKSLIETASGQSLRLDLDAFRFVHSDDSQVSYLHNHFDHWRQLPDDEREAGLIRAAQSILALAEKTELPESWEEAAGGLLLRLRPLAHLHAMRIEMELRGTSPEVGLASVPVGKHLGAQLVYDTPDTIIQFPLSQLEQWDVGLYSAFRQARSNLFGLEPMPFAEIEDGVYAATGNDCYDSARLMLVDAIEELSVRGRAVALAANRDTLLITGEHDEAGLHVLLEHAVAAAKAPRLDTLRLLRLENGRWREWLPPTAHALHAEWVELAVRTTGTGYADVRTQLVRRCEANVDDVFVAKFGALEIDGILRSYAVWPPVPTLLPEVDLVVIALTTEPDGAYAHVAWADVVELAGDLLVLEPNVEPPYWRAKEPLSEELLAALRERALPISPD